MSPRRAVAAPVGLARISHTPWGLRCSFGAADTASGGEKRIHHPLLQVLHLLAKLLDHALELKADIGEFHIIGLRAQGIDLAIELLRQEIQPPAHRPARFDEEAGLSDMADETIEILTHMGLGGDQARLL